MKECRLGKNIKALLKDCKMTQRELSDIVGVTPEAVSRWISGENYPSLLNLIGIADYFCISVDDLVYGDSNDY